MGEAYHYNLSELYKRVISHLGRGTGKVLDAGSGSGVLANKIESLGFDVYACDIKASKILSKRISFKKIDMNKKLPYSDSKFDFIVCVEVIEHVRNIENLIKEFHRILKRKGKIILTTPNITNLYSRIKFLLKGEFFLFSKNEKEFAHVNPMTWWKLRNSLETAGFRVKHMEEIGFLNLGGYKSYPRRHIFRVLYYLLSSFLDKKMLSGDNLLLVAEKI